MVGGTGLYVRALLHGVVEAPGTRPGAARPGSRRRRQRPRAGGAAPAARRGGPGARPRASGRTTSSASCARWRSPPAGAPRASSSRPTASRRGRYRYRLLALDVPRDELHRRIDARVEAMAAAGILDEARALLARFGRSRSRRLPIGYADAVACARGDDRRRGAGGAHRARPPPVRPAAGDLAARGSRTWSGSRPPFDAAALARAWRSAP